VLETQSAPFDIKTLPLDPGATAVTAFVPFPIKTPVKVVAPVPPFATGNVAEVLLIM
jgi:hypothetical protein